jgi:hypothetical protein
MNAITKISMAAMLALTCTLFGVEWQRINALQRQLEWVPVSIQPTPKPVEHKYRFERNGASLWRYDETTGETCQVTSNQIDKWIGGRCPPR